MGVPLGQSLKPFCKLRDPSSYVGCTWDLTLDAAGRSHWTGFHRRHIRTLLGLAIEAAAARGESPEAVNARAEKCREELVNLLDRFAENPHAFGEVTILTLDRWRDTTLRRYGFPEPMIDLKARENARMLPLLPQICAEIDALSGRAQIDAVVQGVFAGNIFDMGSEATAKAFLGKSPDFFAIRHSLAPRPWLIDDYDRLAGRFLDGPPHRKAVFFIDNAGSDFLLGALPMMRWLARRGTRIVIAANDRPTLNDMTISDVRAWWPRILETEPSLADLPIECSGTGTGDPLIDLAQVSDELNDAARDADLIILEGMGRGVESNLDAEFTCEAINLAMIKDEAVALRHGGKLYDIVCKIR